MYEIQNDQGKVIDATFTIDGTALIFHSRGGTKGARGVRNVDYSKGLMFIFERILASTSTISIKRILVDSKPAQKLSERDRTVFDKSNGPITASKLVTLVNGGMRKVGQELNAAKSSGNQTKCLRIEFFENASASEIVSTVRGELIVNGALPAEQQKRVNAKHIWEAVERLSANPDDHNFGTSTKFDIMVDDQMILPSKAVFGVALGIALGLETHPEHFVEGEKSICLGALKDAGYEIIEKGGVSKREKTSISSEDISWAEGSVKHISHLTRERKSGLSTAKKIDFMEKHDGKLFCERCKIDPIECYGEFGASCIEVHHIIPLADADQNQRTKLTDLQCLCANCHRIVHKEMREEGEG